MSIGKKQKIVIINLFVTLALMVMALIISPVVFGEYVEDVDGGFQLTKESEQIVIAWIVAWLASTGSLIILTSIGWLKQNPTKAEKMLLLLNDFDEVAEHIEKLALGNGYENTMTGNFGDDEIQCRILVKNQFDVSFFETPLSFLLLVKMRELQSDEIDTIKNRLWHFIQIHYGQEQIFDRIRLVLIVCVDKVTPAFYKYTDSNIEQGFKFFWLPVGISFGGKTVYIAKQKGGLAITQYKKLRKEFITLMGNVMKPLS